MRSRAKIHITAAALASLLAPLSCNAVLGIEEARLSCPGDGECPASVAQQRPAAMSGAPAPGAAAATTSVAGDSPGMGLGARTSRDAGTADTGPPAVKAPARSEEPTGNTLPIANATPNGAAPGAPGSAGTGNAGTGNAGTAPSGTTPDASVGSAPPSEPPAPSEPPVSTPTPAACPLCDSCSAAGFACQGTQLFSCDPVRRQSALVSDCGNAARCDAARGSCVAPPVCTPSMFSCDGARLLTCSADGSAVTNTATCASAALCDARAGTCQQPACAPNEHRCQGSQLLLCKADLTGLDVAADCGNPELCDAADGRCNLCVPGARRCADVTTVAVCAASGLTEDNTGCGLLETCSGGTCSLLGGVPLP